MKPKPRTFRPAHGLEQGKLYASCKRLNVPFVFSSNGHLFVEFDRFTGMTAAPRTLAEFPTPADLRARYEQGMGFSLADPPAKPLLTRYAGGEATRRYYQDAAIRAVLEKVARGEKRALLSLATGAGKTFIAVNLLKRIADAGQLRKALFICDREELRNQGEAAFKNAFGADAAAVDGRQPAKERPCPDRHLPDPRRGRRRGRRQLPDHALPGRLLQSYRHRRMPPLRLGQVVASADAQPRRRADRLDRHAARSRRFEDTDEAKADAQITADNRELLRRSGLRIRNGPGHRRRLPGGL